MSYYNKAEPRKYIPEEPKPLPSAHIENKKIPSHLHDELVRDINNIDQEGLLVTFKKKTRDYNAEGHFSRAIMLNYNALAEQQYKKAIKLKQKLRERQIKRSREKAMVGRTPKQDAPEEVVDFNPALKEESKEDQEIKLREHSENPEKLEKKAKLAKIMSIMKTPLFRVGAFVIIGIFLLFYMTRVGLAEIVDSPFIVVLVVLILLLIIGKGGKTRKIAPIDY